MRYHDFSSSGGGEIITAFWTATFTLLGGILIFATQKLLEQIYFVPINKQKDVIEQIAVGLIKFANYYANPTALGNMPSDSTQKRDLEIAADITRGYSALLTVVTNNINIYGTWCRLKFIKVTKEDALAAADKLMALSNSYFNPGSGALNSDLANEIRQLLNIPRS